MKLLLLFLVYVTYGQDDQDDDPFHSKKFGDSDDLPEGDGIENPPPPPETPLPGGVPPELPEGETDYRCKGSAFTECLSDVEEFCGSSDEGEDEGPPPPPGGVVPSPPEGEDDEGPPPPPEGKGHHMDPNKLRECLVSNFDSFSDNCKDAIQTEWGRITEARSNGPEPPEPEGNHIPEGKGYPPEGEEGKGYPPEGEEGKGYPPEGEEGEEGKGYPPEGEEGKGYPPEGEGKGLLPSESEDCANCVGEDNDIEDSDLFCMLNPMPCRDHHYGNRGEGVYIIGARKGKGKGKGKGDMWGGKGKGKGGWSCVIVAFKPSSTEEEEGGPNPPGPPDDSNPPPERPGSDDFSLPPVASEGQYSYVYYGDYGDYQYQYQYDDDDSGKPIGGSAISGSSSPVGYILLGMFLVMVFACIFWRYHKRKNVEVPSETTGVPAPDGKEETAPKSTSFLSMLKDKITSSTPSSPYVALHV